MYFVNQNEELTLDKISRIIQDFSTKELPRLKQFKNYYDGKQKILYKIPTDNGKPCNKILVNYCHNIVDNYLGYLTGKPITYENGKFEDVLNVLNYNDVRAEDAELLRNALIYGRAFEINYIDEDGQQRFKVLDSQECIPIYENTLNANLMYLIRFYKVNMLSALEEKYTVEVYSKGLVQTYSCSTMFSGLALTAENPLYFNQIPVTVFSLNREEESVFGQILSLQDAYNTLLSSSVDDWESFCDSYLILKGQMADADDLAAMKEHRCLILDSDADASFLTKNINDTQIQNLMTQINDQIYRKANCPDFSDETFMSQSGEALKYKLVGFENSASAIESQMRKALQKRIELICSILSLTISDAEWRDVRITFTRNLPSNIDSIANTVNALRGLVSNRTLLSQIPFVENVDEEMAEVKKEAEENMSFYSLGEEEDAATDETEN